MRLSSADMIVEYRAKLKALRFARNSVVSGTGGKLVAQTWYHGEQIDFCNLLSKTNLKAHLGAMLDHEIAETVRAIEAHGVVCDE